MGRGTAVGGDLIGRGPELARLRRFLRDAAADGGALLVLGDPGVGKTALLDAAAWAAAASGERVLRVDGAEFEADLSFAGLNQLLLPLRDDVALLRPALRGALAVALGSAEGPPPDRLVLANAVLELLRVAASARPLLAIVDDLPWVDRPSAVTLGVVARRLRASHVGLLASSRPEGASFFDRTGLPELELRPLEDQAAEALLEARSPALPARVRRRVLAEARGNPLALVELPAALGTTRLASARALPSVLPLTRRLVDVFAERLATLPDPSRRLLLLAALEGTGDLDVLLAGGIHAPADLEPAEEARLVAVDEATGRLEFGHPLIRSAVVERATDPERRRAQATLAGLLADEPERAAWHRAEAAVDRDEAAAELLERAAQDRLRRGDAVGAVRALTRAAALSPAGRDRGRRLALAAYVGADVTGDLRDGAALLRDAEQLGGAGGGGSLAAAVAAAYVLLNGEGDVETAHRLLAGAIDGLGADGVDAAVLGEALHTLMLVCFFGGRPELWAPFDAALARLEPRVPEALWLASRTYRDPAASAAPALDRLDGAIGGLGREADPSHIVRVGIAAFYVDRLAGCRDPLWRVVRDGREGGAVASAIDALMLLGFDDLGAGRWDEAERLVEEALALCVAGGYDLLAWPGRFAQALLAAGRGDHADAEAIAAAMTRWATPRGVRAVEVYAAHARALAALGRGDYDVAYRQAAQISPPGVLAPRVAHALWVAMDLVEAAVHLDRQADAARHVRALRAAGVGALSSRLALVVAGSEAMATADAGAAERFARALATPGAVRWPFELARVELAFGERLRRDGAMTEARTHLRAAQAAFERLGARPWELRAGAELRATGLSRSRRREVQRDALTPQERAIAQLAAAGLTNKQIGTRLFLSHRTVGAHLYRAFPKLGITSRAALRDALATAGASDAREAVE